MLLNHLLPVVASTVESCVKLCADSTTSTSNRIAKPILYAHTISTATKCSEAPLWLHTSRIQLTCRSKYTSESEIFACYH